MFRSGMIVMAITLLSRGLGLLRTVLIAYYFGATKFTDAYFSAFKISNFFRQVLGEGALGTVFVPNYNKKTIEEGEEESSKLIYSILFIVFLFTFVLSLGTLIFSGNIINFIVKGYNEETKKIAAELLKIMSFYLLFIGMSGMIGAILNNFKSFIVPAATSIFFNLSIIIFSILYNKTFGIKALAYGVLCGGILQFLIVIPKFIKYMKNHRVKIDLKDIYIKNIFLMLLPMLVGIFARQINSIVDQFFASYLKTGGVTALENATRLYNLPLGVFGISIANVVYPSLSRAIEEKEYKNVEKILLKGLTMLGLLVIPAMALLIFYPLDIVELIFGNGRYSAMSLKVTAESLLFYSLGLLFYTSIHLVARAFYGMKNTKDPVKISILSIIFNIVMNIILVKRYQHIGLALSTALSSGINLVLLMYLFRRKYFEYLKINILKYINIIFSIALISTVVAVGIKIITMNLFYNIFIKIFLFIIMHVIIYYIGYKKIKSIKEIIM